MTRDQQKRIANVIMAIEKLNAKQSPEDRLKELHSIGRLLYEMEQIHKTLLSYNTHERAKVQNPDLEYYIQEYVVPMRHKAQKIIQALKEF